MSARRRLFTGEITMSSLEGLLTRNLYEIFGERDAVKRRQVIFELWQPQGIFIDPDGRHEGHAALDAAVAALQAQFPNFVFSEAKPPQSYHGVGCLAWNFGAVSASPEVTGIDIAVFEDGKIAALYTFLEHA